MKSPSLKPLLPFLVLFFLSLPLAAPCATMNDYCQIPPFVASVAPPNVLFVNDVSGSMSYEAYSYGDDQYVNYDKNVGYEGYFDPEKKYAPDADGIYQETTVTETPCACTCTTWKCRNKDYGGCIENGYGCSGNQKWGCCSDESCTGDCNTESGNYLNYVHMHRIDLLRWALTGGSPATCVGNSHTFDPGSCDPELWRQSGNSATGKVGTVCNDSLDVNGDGIPDGGCILVTDDGTEVKVPWSRVYEGLAFQFETLPVRPRLGAEFFDGNGVRSDKVYVGDFLQSNSSSADFPYQNLITDVNSQEPGGGTATGEAMWDAFNYFAQNSPQFGGFDVQNGSGDRWKNPLYVCDGQGGNNCQYFPCVRNFVILMSDGEWNTPSCSIGSSPYTNSSDPVVPAYQMHMGFTNAPTGADTSVSDVYTIGLFMSGSGLLAMENTAMYGSFDKSAGTWPGSLTGYPTGSCCSDDTSDCGSCTSGGGTGTNASGSVCAQLPDSSSDWDKNDDNEPDTFFSSDNALGIKQSILDAVLDILARATSGTAASVLASGEGSGANLVQATYYPRRQFYNSAVSWVGGVQNFWYYVDPMFSLSNIREEGQPPDYLLDLLAPSGDTDPSHHDYILNFYYDESAQKAMAKRFYDEKGNGVEGAQIDTVDFDTLGSLWEAGKELWEMPASSRLIYTPLDTTQPLTSSANQFTTANLSALRPFLNTDASVSSDTVTEDDENNQLATNLIDWVRGTDIAPYTFLAGTVNYRSRTVALDDTSGTNVWKLGDIIDSTPKIVGSEALNTYDKAYGDNTYADFTGDNGSTVDVYKNRGMVFVGANDGMLHAFRLGRLGLKWASKTSTQQATLKYCSNDSSTACAEDSDCDTGATCVTDPDLGKEKWAFIPRSALPYLKYLTDTSYCHLFTVDLTPYVFDASIGTPSAYTGDYWDYAKTKDTWRTILIGGMRYGGACKNIATTCDSSNSADLNGDGTVDDSDCVKTPASDPADSSNGLGYSSYFALDITDPANPQFMWEFNDSENNTTPHLGFSSSGPVIVRVSARDPNSDNTSSTADNSKNGRWFVVFGSGPTGPINTTAHQNLGRSDQDLRLFILDLRTGNLVRTIDTGIPDAYAGTIVDNNQDTDADYQDNAVYVGYVKKCTDSSHQCTTGTWTDGGILRLLTNEDLAGPDVSAGGDTALNPANWVTGTVIDGIGPVTTAVGHMEDNGSGDLWLYAGTGRYSYRMSSQADDPDQQRILIGVKDPCFAGHGKFKSECLDDVSGNDPAVLGYNDLAQVDLSSAAGVSGTIQGWKILLDTADSQYQAERDITDPVTSTTGLVLFTTFKPYAEQCSAGGKTAMWAVKYDNGAAPGALLKGKALIQVSAPSIDQIDLPTAFTRKNGRETGDIEGVPPEAGKPALISSPPPVKRVLSFRER